MIARIYIKCGSLYSSEHVGYIQQMFADNRPHGLLAYLELAALETVVAAVMRLTGSPLRTKGLTVPAALPKLRTALKGHPSFRGPWGLADC